MACRLRNIAIRRNERFESEKIRNVAIRKAKPTNTRRFSRNQSERSNGAIARTSQIAAYIMRTICRNRFLRQGNAFDSSVITVHTADVLISKLSLFSIGHANHESKSRPGLSSTAQILLSTRPVLRPTPCTTSKLRSVGTPDAFFGQATHRPPF